MPQVQAPELDGPRWGPGDHSAPRQLVVLCHGVGADGNDLIGIAPLWAAAVPNAAFASPNGPFPCDMAPFGRQWFSLAVRTPALIEAGVRTAAPILDAFIDAELARLGLPADAYALMGFSQGAMMSLFVGLRRKAAPRAILAYSGALVAPSSLLREATNHAPVLLVHGEEDEVVPVAGSHLAETELTQAGIPVESIYPPGLGHGIDETGLTAGALFLQNAFAGA